MRKRFRHMNRYREIAMTLARHGFGYLLEEIGLFHMLSLPKRLSSEFTKDHTSLGIKLRLTFEELGPTFIKLGQIISTRRDILPEEVIRELQLLQDRVKPCPYPECKSILEKSLGCNLEEVFSLIEEEPIAAASIGQVHAAWLHTGEKVAVKVKRPDIDKKVETDLEILRDLSRLAEAQFAWAVRYRLRDLIDEFAKSINEELDYTLEARSTEKIANYFKDDPNIKIPAVYWDYSTSDVLTLEFVEGTKLSALNQSGYSFNRKILADRLVHCFFEQIFISGFFHGDPHPGNILFLPDNAIALLDFGQVGRLTKEMRYHISSIVISLMKGDVDDLINTFISMSLITDTVNKQRLRNDFEMLYEKYYDIQFSEIHIGEVITELFETAQKHEIIIPAEYSLLGKAVVTIESLAEELDPELSIIKIAEPYGKQLMKERFHPKRVAESMFLEYKEYEKIFRDMPKQVNEMMTKANKGRFFMNMNLPDMEKFLFKMDRISNRISFSIILLAFSIIMVGLIIGSTFGTGSSFLTRLPVIEIGFVISFFMFLWLLFAIFRSGRF